MCRRWRTRHHGDHTNATQAVPGGSRSWPVAAGSRGREAPAVAGNSGSEPVAARCAVPACHAGGRGLESRRSRKIPCKLAYCVVGSDARSGPTTQTLLSQRPKATKTDQTVSGLRRSQADPGGVHAGDESGVRLHETTGGRGPVTRAIDAGRASRHDGLALATAVTKPSGYLLTRSRFHRRCG
jgi:hypothetical protein